MNVTRFYPEHLWQIELPDVHPWPRQRDLDYARYLASGVAITARHEGRIIACGGVAPVADDAGICWSFLSHDAGPHILALSPIARRLFKVCGFARVFANTEVTFSAGCRWLELLGFKRLHTFEGFAGREEFLYERVS